MLRRRHFLPVLALGFSLGAALPAFAAGKMPVVASFSILADLVRQVGGEHVEVSSLVPPGGDAHVFQPTPKDARAVSKARLVFVSGLGFEGWMERLAKQSGGGTDLVDASDGITLRRRTVDEPQEADAAAPGHGIAVDPHAWQSVANVKIYVANIRDALARADPADKAAYEANAQSYLAKLDALDSEIRQVMDRIPADQRRIVTSHDAFGYYGDAYGLKLIAPQGISTGDEPSAKDIVKLIRQIKADRIRAVFLENMTNPKLIERVAAESGAKIGGELYSDALSEPSGPAGTYIDLMRSNTKELSSALTG